MGSLEFPFVCDGCTVLTGIEFEEAKLDGDTSLKAEMTKHAFTLGKASLNDAAQRVRCQTIDKQLPPLPDPMPEKGSNELKTYAQACPAFKQYAENLSAKLQQPQAAIAEKKYQSDQVAEVNL